MYYVYINIIVTYLSGQSVKIGGYNCDDLKIQIQGSFRFEILRWRVQDPNYNWFTNVPTSYKDSVGVNVARRLECWESTHNYSVRKEVFSSAPKQLE